MTAIPAGQRLDSAEGFLEDGDPLAAIGQAVTGLLALAVEQRDTIPVPADEEGRRRRAEHDAEIERRHRLAWADHLETRLAAVPAPGIDTGRTLDVWTVEAIVRSLRAATSPFGKSAAS